MSRMLVCAVAAVAMLAGSALAQDAPKGGGGAAPAGGGGELKLPAGRAGGEAEPAGKIPGAAGGGASPGMKPTASDAAKPEPGPRKQGENAGVEPEGKAGQPAPNGEGKPAAGEAGKGTEAGQKPGQPAAGNKAGQAGGAEGKPGAAAKPAPQLSGDQRTRVSQSFTRANIRPVRVDFRVNVGVAVPRTVVLEPLPPEVITIVPAYESYRFFAVPGEIVIVDPITLEIVAILPL